MANPSGKSKYTKEQRLGYARRALESGLSQLEFATREGIPQSSISNWIASYKKAVANMNKATESGHAPDDNVEATKEPQGVVHVSGQVKPKDRVTVGTYMEGSKIGRRVLVDGKAYTEEQVANALHNDDGGNSRSDLEKTIAEQGRGIVRLQEANGRLMADLKLAEKTRDMHAETVLGLKQALEDERTKVKSLMNAVIVLGHQVGDD